ncbi:hypothetical protein [Acidicapsa ligni]|uniref:hypothetical protein n=1 Tax=Acidicapsa ligni TaxID=542300 RepID=UPI0021DF5414|nr:hypothetical protein [Acidicapsa ligni]
MSRRLKLVPALLLPFLVSVAAFAQSQAFDLSGPKVDVHVQRAGKTLPIAQVPNLLPGDRLWIHPDLPDSQSTHLILVVAFLRGATNPPPPDWFRRVETWTREVREEGVFVVVPAEAQQALIFLAPETGGDFSTLRNAVRGRPGAFVRATQDLQLASWDRLRLNAYLAEIKAISQEDPKDLKEHTSLAARSLGMRLEQQCFDKPSDQQAPCLVQHTDGLVLDDAGIQSHVTQITNGSAADLMNQLSYSTLGGAGQFSPYVGAIVDLARILSTFHTAKYQYIPALALPQKEQPDTLNLRLNVPPSFRDPKSVIVVALPPIGPSHPPDLRPIDPAQNYCAPKPKLALAVDDAPLVFGTDMAHDLYLHIETKAKFVTTPESNQLITPSATDAKMAKPTAASVTGAAPAPAESGIDIPVRADPREGGLVLEKPLPAFPENEVVGELRGQWGFDTMSGPKFRLVAPHSGAWSVPSSDHNALIIGRDDTLRLEGASSLCVSDVEAQLPPAHEPHGEPKPIKLTWKSPKPEQLEFSVPLKEANPGIVTISVHQYGLAKPDQLSLRAYAEAASIDHLTLSAGDKSAVLKGKRLDEVESADLAGIGFNPAALNRVQDFDQLEMTATGLTGTLQPGSSYTAKVSLRDGRELRVPATVGSPRPQIDLLSKGVQHDQSEADGTTILPVHLGSTNDLPLQRRLVFFLRSRMPAAFPRTEKIELGAVDGSFQTTLSLSDGSLMLEDAHTAVAVIDPLTRFGSSAFGPLQMRAVSADGITGDWIPLGTLVRLPGFNGAPGSKDLRCPRSTTKPCQLSGSNLFLITAISANPDMSNAIDVPAEFSGTALTIPNVTRTGTNGTLYLSLRDDPSTVQTLTLPIAQQPGQTGQTAQTGAQASPAADSLDDKATPQESKAETKPADANSSDAKSSDAKPSDAKPKAKSDSDTQSSSPN